MKSGAEHLKFLSDSRLNVYLNSTPYFVSLLRGVAYCQNTEPSPTERKPFLIMVLQVQSPTLTHLEDTL